MGPVRHNPIQRTVRTAHLSVLNPNCTQLSVALRAKSCMATAV